jgi:hypothetical protein
MPLRFVIFLLALVWSFVARATVPTATLFPVKQGAKWGLVDGNGRAVLPFAYDSIFGGRESGAFALEAKGLHGLADLNGRILLPVRYGYVGSSFDHNGLAEIKIGDHYGLIDRSNKIRLSAVFGDAPSAFDRGKLYVVSQNGLQGVLNIDTHAWVVPPTLLVIGSLAKNGLAWAATRDHRVGFIDAGGRWNIPPGRFDDAFYFDDDVGLAPAMKDGKWGFINGSGRWVMPPWDEDLAMPMFGDNGLAAVVIRGKYGYVDAAGKMVIRPRFGDANEFYRGLASVKLGRKWGAIDTKGRLVLRARYDNAPVFRADGIAVVSMGNRSWYVDRRGRRIFGNYEETRGFEDGWAAVKLRGKWGAIDTRGRWLLRPVYTCVRVCDL